MGAILRAVVHIDALLSVLLGNNVDNTSHRVRAVQRTLRTLHDFYLFDVLRINESQVVLTSHIAVNALAVY